MSQRSGGHTQSVPSFLLNTRIIRSKLSPTSDYNVTAIRVWRTLTHTEAKMSPANDELYTWSVCSSSKTWGAVLCSSPTHSDAVNQQSSSSVTQPARGRISPRTPHTYMPPLKWGVEFIRHLKPGLCTFYQGNQLESLPVFKLSYTHTHRHPLFHDDVCFSHYSLLRKETDRMSPACLSIRWIFESVRVCLRARCFKVMGLRTTWSRCGWAILSLYRSWFPASVFPLRYRPLKKQLPAVEHAHECSPVKKKKKKKSGHQRQTWAGTHLGPNPSYPACMRRRRRG